jgi:cation diffusion facilitator CzcD-associated flavoprotein CzcO
MHGSSPAAPSRTDVVIIGSGFAGIGMGIRLLKAGRDDFVILEKDADLGGTWRDNTYPGCECDVPSYLYSFSFEQNPHWTKLFSPQEEIWDYLRHCVEKYGLAPHIRYDAEVTGAAYDEQTTTWQVEVNGSELIDAKVLVSGVGALHMPSLPDLPGLETFTGATFHSAKWRHHLDLTGRKVAVIGTGASAIQFVPQIAPIVDELDLYQRSAAWVTPKPNPPITEKQRAFYARHPLGQRAMRTLVYWALEARGTGFALTPKAMKLLEKSARHHLHKQVADPELRAKLEPDYQIGCKRILLSNDFYPALARDNVEVVTDPIAEVRPLGIVDGQGVERPADTIIFGTGFEISGNLTHMKVVGRGGAVLNDVWDEAGIGAHLGISVSGFPNLFLLLGPNTGLGHSSVVFMIESQISYVLQALDLLDHYGAGAMEVRADTQQGFLDRIQNRLAGTVWQSGCKSWYIDENGRNFAIWPHFTWKYWLETRKLDPTAYVLSRSRSPARS